MLLKAFFPKTGESSFCSSAFGSFSPFTREPLSQMRATDLGRFQLGAQTNVDFYHAVRQMPGAQTASPRFSVTFRKVQTFKDGNGEVRRWLLMCCFFVGFGWCLVFVYLVSCGCLRKEHTTTTRTAQKTFKFTSLARTFCCASGGLQGQSTTTREDMVGPHQCLQHYQNQETFFVGSLFGFADFQVLGRGALYPTLNWPTELNGQHRLDEQLEEPLPGARSER